MMDTVPTTTGGPGHSDTAKLKRAYQHHPKTVTKTTVPSTQIETGIDAGGTTTATVTLERSALRKFYAENIMFGKKSMAGTDWPDAATPANLSYSGAPILGVIVPEGEAAPGETGSTIVASGLGPNVNIHPIADLDNRENVDASMPGSTTVLDPNHSGEGSADPHATSVKISSDKIGAEGMNLPPGGLGDATSGGY